MRPSLVLLFLLGCATGAATSSAIKSALATTPAPGTPRWEYACVPGLNWGEQMNKLGAQGWELVTYAPGGNGSDACFKRPL